MPRQQAALAQLFVPSYVNPSGWVDGQRWREFVKQQPVMINCRDVLISQLSALPWQITARKVEEEEDYADEIEYYTDILRHAAGESFDIWLERGLQDLLTLPVGWNDEIGWYKDGTLAWVDNLDGVTCYPTYNPDYPLAQYLPNTPQAIFYPKHQVARSYMSPRPEMLRRGWGMAPPEKIYLAVKMLIQGDQYYWRFVVDTPEAGILDLMDMSQESATQWLSNWLGLIQGVDPFKIGVLYEHTKEAKFLAFQRPPSEIMMDSTMLWYATMTAAGYGIPLSEIGLGYQSTLAGSIREDRRSRRTGFGSIVDKATTHVENFLPKYLAFKFEFRDEEALVNLGRARSTSATALAQLVDKGIITRESALSQLKADGLLAAGAELGEDPIEKMQKVQDTLRSNERNDDLDRSPDLGGHGAIKGAVRKAMAALLPIYRSQLAYGHEHIVDLGQYVRSSIMGLCTDSESSLHDYIQTQTAEIPALALDVAADLMSKPWSYKTLSNAPLPEYLEGTALYRRIYRITEGALRGTNDLQQAV